MTKTYVIAAAVALLLAAGIAHAQDFAAGDAKAVPVSVKSVQAGGHWEAGDKEGFYRVVVTSGGFEHVISRLYIQWIAVDQDARAYTLARNVDVKELNGGGSSVILPQPKFADKGAWTIAVTVRTRTGAEEKRVITVQPSGAYRIR
jgi:hypothetical protein